MSDLNTPDSMVVTTLYTLGFLVLMLFVAPLVFMVVWNAFIPELFNAPVLNYWQALGIVLLKLILFNK